MKTRTGAQVVPGPQRLMTGAAFPQYARAVVAQHGERILAEVPTTLRRIGMLFVVLSVSIPLFSAGLLVVLWHLAH